MLGAKPISAVEHNRRVERMLAQERWNEQQRELPLQRLQQMIDQQWELTLEARAELEARAAQSCHRGPGDPDWAA